MLEPSSDPAVAPHDLAVFVDPEAVIDITLEVVEHPPEHDHLFLRFLPAVPGLEKGFGRRHRRERAAAMELASGGGEKPPPFGLARVIEGPPQPAEGAGDLLPAFHAFLGRRPAAAGGADFVADVDHRARGEQEGVEIRVDFDIAVGQPGEDVALPRTVGVHVPVLRGEGLRLAVRPAFVVGVPVCRVPVCSVFHGFGSRFRAVLSAS